MLKEVNDKNIDEQGERMVPAFHAGALVYGEHITRYESIAHLLKDKVVLDIASGSGYGSYIMAESAQKVIGVEIDQDSVDYATRNYGRKNIEFKLGSAEEIPLKDASVDVVVTFETIEHIENYRKFLREIKRVLKPDGFAIVSTPNDPEFPEGNHFHLHEFEEEELQNELAAYFKYQKMSYQYTWMMAATMKQEDAGKAGALNSLELQNLAPLTKEKALYFMVICSDNSIDDLEVKSIGALSEHYSARGEQDRVANYENTIESLKGQLATANERIEEIYNSKSWKIISSLYTFRHNLKIGRKEKSDK